MSGKDEACCACLAVEYKATECGGGKMREHWECSSCHTEFVRKSKYWTQIEIARKKHEGYLDDLDKALERCEKAESALLETQDRLMSANRALDVAEQNWKSTIQRAERAEAKVKELLKYTSAHCPGCGRDFVVLEVFESKLAARVKELEGELDKLRFHESLRSDKGPGYYDTLKAECERLTWVLGEILHKVQQTASRHLTADKPCSCKVCQVKRIANKALSNTPTPKKDCEASDE